MSDPALIPDSIIEAAARALCVHTTGGKKTWGYPLEREWYCGLAEAALAAVTPLIEARTLERAAKVAEEHRYFGLVSEKVITGADIAADIRALKEQP